MNFYMGVVCDMRSDWQQYMAEPEADKRLTDPVKIQADLARKRAVQQETAGCLPLVSKIVSACVIDEKENEVFRAAGPDDVLDKVIPFLHAEFDSGLGDASRAPFVPPKGFRNKLFGIAIRDTLRTLAYQAAERGTPLPDIYWRWRLGETTLALDPFEDFFSSDFQKNVGPGSLLRALGIDDVELDPAKHSARLAKLLHHKLCDPLY